MNAKNEHAKGGNPPVLGDDRSRRTITAIGFGSNRRYREQRLFRHGWGGRRPSPAIRALLQSAKDMNARCRGHDEQESAGRGEVRDGQTHKLQASTLSAAGACAGAVGAL